MSLPFWAALLAVVANLAWLLGVAPITLDYLGTPLTGALNEFLRVAAQLLRQRLREDAREPRIIKTQRGEGYVLAAAVTEMPAGEVP